MKKNFTLLLASLMCILTSEAQNDTIVFESMGSGNLPAGWSQTDITFTTSAGGYANFTSLNAVLESPVINLSGYSNIQFSFDVAKFGTGGDGPLDVEFSTDGGNTWTAQSITSPTPINSTYLTSGPTNITVTGSNVKFRFIRPNSPSQKRLRNVLLVGTLVSSGGDTIAPELQDGIFLSNTQIKLGFSEPLDSATAQNASNYIISPTTVTSAVLTSPDTVLLTVSPALQVGVRYDVTIFNIEDTASNVMDTFNVEFWFNDYAGNDLVISEIFYYWPNGFTQETKFIEIYNRGSQAINMSGLEVDGNMYFMFDTNFSLQANDYVLLVQNIDSFNLAFPNVTNPNVFEWFGGNLNLGGQTVEILNTYSIPVNSVSYTNQLPWNPLAGSGGFSLQLCDLMSDNSLAENWNIGLDTAGTINGISVVASPGMINSCLGFAPTPEYTIGQINTTNAQGVADSLNVYCWTQGVVLGVAMRVNGLQFTLFDNGGIGIFNPNNTFGYTVNEGDSVRVRGTINQFNGLTQINIDTLVLINSGNTIPSPRLVTSLGEDTESELIELEKLIINEIVSSTATGSSYKLRNYDGVVQAFELRVVNITNVDDSITLSVDDTLCNVVGIGGQFDSSLPYTSFYQIIPRFYTDLNVNTCTVTSVGEVSKQHKALKVYPNPVSANQVLRLNKTLSFSVINALGQTVDQKTNANVLDVSAYPNGLYIIKSTDGEVEKFIVR